MDRKKLSIGITCYPTFGGSGVIATEIGKAMAKRGHRVHFICSAVPGRLTRFEENIYFHEVEVVDYPVFNHTPYSLSLASKQVEVATFERLDILHVHYAVPHATSAYLAKQVLGELAPKVITTLHGTDITLVGNNRSYLPITRFSIFQSDAVTVPSQYLRLATYDKLNLSTNKPIEVIPNFVDIDLFKPLEPGSDTTSLLKPILGACPKSTGMKVLTHTSNFRPVKRVGDVIRIFNLVQQELNAKLVLIGDGPERSNAESLVRELKIEDRVCFLGKLDSFVDVLQRSDLFLLPSETESFGLAALEAMSCGVPVISSNVDGLPEVVVEDVTGHLCELGDVQTMARKAVALLKDQVRHKAFSEASRKRAVTEFEENKLCDQYEEYYYRVVAGRA